MKFLISFLIAISIVSIVAKEEKSGDYGVCGFTDITNYGSLVPFVSLNGAVATQAYVNVV